jgi:threonine dehydrogenase-like Zn-dependent dehydrogenase
MMMKAAINERYGPPDIVKVRQSPKPQPKADEILIKVYATTISRTDCVFGLSPCEYGAHAEYLCMPETAAMATMPEGTPFGDAVVCEGLGMPIPICKRFTSSRAKAFSFTVRLAPSVRLRCSWRSPTASRLQQS